MTMPFKAVRVSSTWLIVRSKFERMGNSRWQDYRLAKVIETRPSLKAGGSRPAFTPVKRSPR